MATNARDRILIVEKDPAVADLIARQALQATGYETIIVSDASAAISKVIQTNPDVIIANLNLPGLSGKDLLVALSSQGVTAPVIVLAQKGMEADIIQAFRLGAVDYLLVPVREAEVINAVERALRLVRERRERDHLAHQVQQTNQELQMRVRELTAIYAIGKAVTSVTDQALLFEKILDGAVKVAQSDLGWFLLRDEHSKNFLLAAQINLPTSLAERINQVWDDGISPLVAMSCESLSIHGEPVRRFKIASLGQSALIVPVRVQKQVIGIITVMRRQPLPFSSSEQNLLEAVADYASISMINVRLFRTLEERAHSSQVLAETAQVGEKINHTILQTTKKELRTQVGILTQLLSRFDKIAISRWSPELYQAFCQMQEGLQNLSRIVETLSPMPITPKNQSIQANLNELVQQTLKRFGQLAQQNNLTLNADLPNETITALVEPMQISQVLDGLVSNAIKFSHPGGKVSVRIERTQEQMVHVVVSDTGAGIEPHMAARVFEASQPSDKAQPLCSGGIGIDLHLVREIIIHQKGKIWVESKPKQGSRFHFILPAGKYTP